MELIVYQMNTMETMVYIKTLGGPIALLKYQTTRTCNLIADHAAQIFGGRSVTKTGMGDIIFKYITAYKIGAIYGGSEEIMVELGVSQALRNFPKNS